MRFTVHADQPRIPVEFELATGIEAISKAWTLMGAGATGVYIYDDEMDQAYWPHEFSALRTLTMSEANLPRAPLGPVIPAARERGGPFPLPGARSASSHPT